MRLTPKEHSQLVTDLNSVPQYAVMVREILALAPKVPPFDYKGESNIEEIKAKLAQREMHRLVMTLLTAETQND